MGATLAKILMAALTHSSDVTTLVAEMEAEFQTIAHGEGGAAKVAAASAGAAAVAGSLAKVAADVA